MCYFPRITAEPEIIHRYIKTKGVVDVVDKLYAQCNTARGHIL